MMEPQDQSGGPLEKLRANETVNKLTRGHPNLLIFGAPVVLVLIIVALVGGAVAMAGGGSDDTSAQGDRTPTAAASRTPQSTTTPQSAGLKTPIAVSPGDELALSDLAARGAGVPVRGPFTGERLIIPSIGVDAPFSLKVVPSNGQMPNPNGPNDVAYYDFSAHDGLGGTPGLGGNVVLAGHVDYINVGPAVFWDLHDLSEGDTVQIRMTDGSVVEYQIEFNKTVEAGDAPWAEIVSGTADESITIITCGGEFSAGHYTNRQILWGRRVA
jgi:hypothetical protein